MPTTIPRQHVETKLRNLNMKLTVLGFPALTRQDIDQILQQVWMPTPVNGLDLSEVEMPQQSPSMPGMIPQGMAGMLPKPPMPPQAMPGLR